jgi:hypothetical protein
MYDNSICNCIRKYKYNRRIKQQYRRNSVNSNCCNRNSVRYSSRNSVRYSSVCNSVRYSSVCNSVRNCVCNSNSICNRINRYE